MENDRNKVVVLTAGGAAGTNAAAKKRGKRVPSPPKAEVAQNVAFHEPLQLEYEDDGEDLVQDPLRQHAPYKDVQEGSPRKQAGSTPALSDPSQFDAVGNKRSSEILWLVICFFGIMASFVFYGLLMEYTTSGGRKLHELSFLFVTSALYTLTAAAGRYVRDETPTTIPPARFAILGLTSMGSTWCSVRSLRYVWQQCGSWIRRMVHAATQPQCSQLRHLPHPSPRQEL